MTPEVAKIAESMRDVCTRIDSGVQTLADQARAEASAERDYRRGLGEAWVRLDRDGTTAAERSAMVDDTCADLRYERDVARGMWTTAREALRARQAELSAWQSLLKIEQAEVDMAAYGPEVGL